MPREIRINHREIEDPQKITGIMKRKFQEQGLNIHVNEVEELIDDERKGERILKVKNTKYFYGK